MGMGPFTETRVPTGSHSPKGKCLSPSPLPLSPAHPSRVELLPSGQDLDWLDLVQVCTNAVSSLMCAMGKQPCLMQKSAFGIPAPPSPVNKVYFLSESSVAPWDLTWERFLQMAKPRLSSHSSLSLTLWPVMSLSMNSPPRRTETSLTNVESDINLSLDVNT